MKYSLLQAAGATGLSKSTIFRAIKSGRLSADRQDDGTFSIDAAELSRLYPLKHLQPVATVPQQVAPETRRHVAQPPGPSALSEPSEADMLREQIALLKESLSEMKETINDLRASRDEAQAATREAIAAIPKQIAAPAPAGQHQDGPSAVAGAETASRVRMGFLTRLWGRQ